MSNILLTIAIPTFNRPKLLLECIDSLIPQIVSKYENEVEIVISDNHSEDNPESALVPYLQKYPFIRFSRNVTNVGDDANGECLINLSTGKYVWLLADDDYLFAKSIGYIFDILNKNQDLALVLVNWSDVDNNRNVTNKKVHPFTCDQSYSDPNEAILQSNLMYGFMSCVIVKRLFWLEEKNRFHYFGTHLILFYLVPRIMLKGSTYIVAETLVAFRHNNDKTWTGTSHYNAFLHSYVKIPRILNDATSNAFKKSYIYKLRNRKYLQNLLIDIVRLKVSYNGNILTDLSDIIKFNSIFWEFWLLVPMFFVPRKIFIILKYVKKTILK